jgi:hypothetical protein
MSTSPTVPPWLDRLTPAERERLLLALDRFSEDWQGFWDAVSSCVSRIYQGQERALREPLGEDWGREYAEHVKPGLASDRLAKTVEELDRLGMPVPPYVKSAVQYESTYLVPLRNTPQVLRPRPDDLLAEARTQAQQGREWFTRLGAAISTSPAHRLAIDLQCGSLTLDGIPYNGLDPNGLRIIDSLRAAMLSGDPVRSSKWLSETIPDCTGGEKSVRRVLSRLPPAIRGLVKAKPGKGRWLALPQQ